MKLKHHACYFILQPNILHYCLSAKHVLVDDSGSCRLTGFDFEDNVFLREMDEEDEGVKCFTSLEISTKFSCGILINPNY